MYNRLQLIWTAPPIGESRLFNTSAALWLASEAFTKREVSCGLFTPTCQSAAEAFERLDSPIGGAVQISQSRYALYSHSIVEGGFELMSYTTRLTPRTSLTIRDEIRSSTS